MENNESNLVGDVRFSNQAMYNSKQCQDLLIEIEAVMTKYKAVKIDLAFDVFKMKANSSHQGIKH